MPTICPKLITHLLNCGFDPTPENAELFAKARSLTEAEVQITVRKKGKRRKRARHNARWRRARRNDRRRRNGSHGRRLRSIRTNQRDRRQNVKMKIDILSAVRRRILTQADLENIIQQLTQGMALVIHNRVRQLLYGLSTEEMMDGISNSDIMRMLMSGRF